VGAAVLLEELEGALLRLVALAGKILKRLLAGRHLLAADDAVVLVLDKVLLGEATGGVLRAAVVNLGLGSNGHHLGHLILLTAILFLRPG
jgi:hypothetical protein